MRPGFEPHDAAGLYAGDALTKPQRRSVEVHAARCKRCRTDLDCLADLATALALVVEPIEPPRFLRGRILAAARAERR
jgi:predicted anti-sigma-YlaC factor YlaD